MDRVNSQRLWARIPIYRENMLAYGLQYPQLEAQIDQTLSRRLHPIFDEEVRTIPLGISMERKQRDRYVGQANDRHRNG